MFLRRSVVSQLLHSIAGLIWPDWEVHRACAALLTNGWAVFCETAEQCWRRQNRRVLFQLQVLFIGPWPIWHGQPQSCFMTVTVTCWSGFWYIISQTTCKVTELKSLGYNSLKRSISLRLADGDKSQEEEGIIQEKASRHLAAEGHTPVRLHAFSTGLSSDFFLRLSKSHTHMHECAHTAGSEPDLDSETHSYLYQYSKNTLKISCIWLFNWWFLHSNFMIYIQTWY